VLLAYSKAYLSHVYPANPFYGLISAMRIAHKIMALTTATLLSLGVCLDAFATNSEALSHSKSAVANVEDALNEGVGFSCEPSRLSHIKLDMAAYLASLGIAPGLVIAKTDLSKGLLTFTLNTPKGDFDTLQLKMRPEYAINDSIVLIPNGHGERGKLQKILTVSKKEILLALLQHGRLTEFSGSDCNLNALKEQVNVRQNIVAWSEHLNWTWPDGGAAEWNPQYWHRGTPLVHVKLHAAFGDAFNHQNQYAIGCYTAAKIVMVQGVLDYYRRIKKNQLQLKLIEDRLVVDKDPLVDVEPGIMWSFEKDYDPKHLTQLGKLLTIQQNIAPKNFVPGDWAYILNTDPISSQKTGYEGSNTIYLGRNKFVDYYNDNNHAYTYHEKLDEVYQWRNGVFSRSRDVAKIKPLSSDDFERLGKSPSENGLMQSIRVFPMSMVKLGFK